MDLKREWPWWQEWRDYAGVQQHGSPLTLNVQSAVTLTPKYGIIPQGYYPDTWWQVDYIRPFYPRGSISLPLTELYLRQMCVCFSSPQCFYQSHYHWCTECLCVVYSTSTTLPWKKGSIFRANRYNKEHMTTGSSGLTMNPIIQKLPA